MYTIRCKCQTHTHTGATQETIKEHHNLYHDSVLLLQGTGKHGCQCQCQCPTSALRSCTGLMSRRYSSDAGCQPCHRARSWCTLYSAPTVAHRVPARAALPTDFAWQRTRLQPEYSLGSGNSESALSSAVGCGHCRRCILLLPKYYFFCLTTP